MQTDLWEDWSVAKKDLQLEIVCPFSIQLPERRLQAEFLLKKFGHTNGMLIFRNYSEVKGYHEQLSSLGYGFSVLEPASKAAYDRASFISMLQDWGWTGSPEHRPAWLVET